MEQLCKLDKRIVWLILVEINLSFNHSVESVIDLIRNVIIVFDEFCSEDGEVGIGEFIGIITRAV